MEPEFLIKGSVEYTSTLNPKPLRPRTLGFVGVLARTPVQEDATVTGRIPTASQATSAMVKSSYIVHPKLQIYHMLRI